MNFKNYDKCFLDYTMSNFGEAFDYASYAYNLSLDQFLQYFISSGYALRYEDGDINVILGMSGTELVLNVFYKLNIQEKIVKPNNSISFSKEFWAGWILCLFQYETQFPFSYIHSLLKMEDILNLYPTLHEASEQKCLDVLLTRFKNNIKCTRLQELRKKKGISQRELANISGVNLRTLQEYENRSKDINKASSQTLFYLSKALNVKIEDLIEYINL